MPESLGARLRRRREEQQIALSTIAERTKIKASLLEALERGDVSAWPAGIYRRAFIRSYAHAIGLDPDPVVREFLELYPDPEESVAEAPAPPSGLRGVVGFALGSLARLGGRGPTTESPGPARTSPLNLHGDPVVRPHAETPPALLPPSLAMDEVAAPEGLMEGLAEALSELAPAPDPETVPHDDEDLERVVKQSGEEDAEPVVAGLPPHQPEPPPFDLDLMSVARTCTGFARAESTNDLALLLADTSRILGALGLIVWVWDPILEALRPALAQGYPEKVLAQLPSVGPDEDNATAAAFRSAEPCAIRGSDDANGALVVPLLTAPGASGVLAIELPHGREQQDAVRAVAEIFAAMLAPLICTSRVSQPEPVDEPVTPAAPLKSAIAGTNGRR